MEGHSEMVTSVCFSPDGSYLASGSWDNTIKLWRVSDEREIRTIKGHTDWVKAVCFGPDGSMLASGSCDETVKLWWLDGMASAPQITHTKPILPANLAASLSFSEPSGNNFLDAEESGNIIVDLQNTGQGDAYALQVQLTLQTNSSNITIGKAKTIDQLKAGESQKIEMLVSADVYVASQSIKIKVEVIEGNGFDLYPPANITFNTRKFRPPLLAVIDVGIDDQSKNGRIEPLEIVVISARIQNKGQGEAKNVTAAVLFGENVYLGPESHDNFTIGSLAPGEYRDITFMVFTNNRATGMPVDLVLSEKMGEYEAKETLDLAFKNRPNRLRNSWWLASSWLQQPSPMFPVCP